jgi:tetratricopeptide (TPR) repeat protein
MGLPEKAEKQYKLALAADPKNVSTHYNYGNLLNEMGKKGEAEKQYKLALKSDPKHVRAHSNYGLLLLETGRLEEAEEQFKVAIELDPKKPNVRGVYSLLLFSKNLEMEAIEEMKIASILFRKNGDNVRENLVLAWLYEDFANKYYILKEYSKSGEYAEISGNKYIEAGKQAGEKFKGISLTKGYTLKGRDRIRRLDFRSPFNIEMFEKILNGIDDASQSYKMAAEASPKENQICDAFSVSMSCLSEMLGYMLSVIEPSTSPTD